MSNMSAFKIVLISVFAVSAVVAVAMFALSKGGVGGGQSANLLVWGTVSPESFDVAYKNSSIKSDKQIQITYVKKDPATFDADFVEALATGTGPDIVVLRDDYLYKNSNKLFIIPFANYSGRSFKDTFIEGGEIFLTPSGVAALPFIVDPMVMYWNRDMFSNVTVSQPPKYWDEIYSLIPKMTVKDGSGSILKSTIALGEWGNVSGAKEIVSMLLLQAGTPITSRTANGLQSVLNSLFDYSIAPSQSAVNFYTQFSNPTSPNYTWNRSLPLSLNMFLSGNLGLYLGFSSEIFAIQQKNSNLNFDVALVPQIRDTNKKEVFGHMYALAIVKQSRQVGGAYLAINALTEATSIKAMRATTNLPPVRRDLLSSTPPDTFLSVFYNSALLSHSWIDPDSVASSKTFRDMIEGITSGRYRLSDALNNADDELTSEIK